jgi:hypothetical protein
MTAKHRASELARTRRRARDRRSGPRRGSTVQLAIVIALLNDDDSGGLRGAVVALRPAGERRPLASRTLTGSER